MLLYDDECLALIKSNINLLVPWYLTSSYTYYVLDFSLLSDEVYDVVCKLLLEHWDEVDHWHKYLIDKDQLVAGTGYALSYEEFPQRVTCAAVYRMRLLEERSKAKPKRKRKPKNEVPV